MNAQHTPGPWKVFKGRDGYGVVGLCGGFYGEIEKEEDARLIAAAPELLAVLTEFKIASDKQEITFDGGAWLERVDAAIAKATGGGV